MRQTYILQTQRAHKYKRGLNLKEADFFFLFFVVTTIRKSRLFTQNYPAITLSDSGMFLLFD